MNTSLSYTKIEKDLLPKFRKQMSTTESTEDVKNFFGYCMKDLFSQAFVDLVDIGPEDFQLVPENDPPFEISGHILSHEAVASVWQASDLPAIIGRFAQNAVNHHQHLTKIFEKTEAKIRM